MVWWSSAGDNLDAGTTVIKTGSSFSPPAHQLVHHTGACTSTSKTFTCPEPPATLKGQEGRAGRAVP